MSRVKIPSTVDRLPETLSLISCVFHSASFVLIWNILEWSLNNSKLNHHSYFFEALNWISVAAHSFFWKDWIRNFCYARFCLNLHALLFAMKSLFIFYLSSRKKSSFLYLLVFFLIFYIFCIFTCSFNGWYDTVFAITKTSILSCENQTYITSANCEHLMHTLPKVSDAAFFARLDQFFHFQ